MQVLAQLFSRVFGSAPENGDAIRDRYLNLLADSLLNQIYLENEARFLYIFLMLHAGQPVDQATVRDISSKLPDLVGRIRSARQEGRVWWWLDVRVGDETQQVNLRNVCEFSHTMIGRKRLENILHCLNVIRRDGIPGDLAETGVWRGGACILMRGYLAAWNLDKTVWVADSFEGMPKPSLPQDAGYDFSADIIPILSVSLDEVKENFRRYGLLDERVRFLKGWFRETLPTAPIEDLALLRLDGDLYESTMDALSALYCKVVTGGFVIVDDYGDFEPCRRAIHEFRAKSGIDDPIERIDYSGVYWRKSG